MNKVYKYKISQFGGRYQLSINNMTLYDVNEYIVKIIKQGEQENTNLKQALNEIREYVNTNEIMNNEDGTFLLKECYYGQEILQIIDKC